VRKKEGPSDLVNGLDMACHYVSLTKVPSLGNRRPALSHVPAVSHRRLTYSRNYRPRTLVAVAAVDKEQVNLKIVYSAKSILLARSEVSQNCSWHGYRWMRTFCLSEYLISAGFAGRKDCYCRTIGDRRGGNPA
jgi:hypothetical protein